MFRKTDKKEEKPPPLRLVPADTIATLKKNLVAGLTGLDFLWGLGIALAISALLISYKYQTIPNFLPGDLATKDIRATQEITIEDQAATLAKKHEAMRKVPAVFDYDPNIVLSMEKDIRGTFDIGRHLLQSARENLRSRWSKSQDEQMISTLKSTFGSFYPDEVLNILYGYQFEKELEDQIISILRSAMKPGVVSNRELLLKNQESGVKLYNVLTAKEETLEDIFSIKDIPQARSALRQNQFELSALNISARKEMIHFLETLITPNINFNSSETQKRRTAAANNVSPVVRQIKQGKMIVRKGDPITDDVLTELDALKKLQRPKELSVRLIGSLFLSVILLYSVWHYFVYHQKRHKKIRNHYLLISLILLLSLITMRLSIVLADILNERVDVGAFKDPITIYYAIPFAFGAILITLLVDVNFGILYSLLFSVFVGIFTNSVDLVCYVLIGSLAAVYGVKQYKERSAIVKAGLTISLVNILAVVALDLFSHDMSNISVIGVKALCALLSGIMAAMIGSLLLPALETVFKITTDIKLLELSNLNTPILRRMAVEAPGTYHHSVVMGTLGEAAAEAIGANPLLVRVAAYYHDIGKMKMPEYYVENQIFGQNKHDKLAPSMSSLIISKHVRDGLEMAREISLLPRVRDMIPQHHGTRLMAYFYEKAKAAAKDGQVNEADYRYPGPKPQTREAAILMISDAVEAASRTLTDPTPAQIQGMIHRIITDIADDGQFNECDITLKDLQLIEQTMLRVLSGIFHHRIEYPGYDFSKAKEERATAKQNIQ